LTIRDIQGKSESWVSDKENKSNADIFILVSLMNRYAKTYIKKAMKFAQIKTSDEFSILITLLTYDSLTKTELINKVVLEKTSGVEIINRLIHQNFIEQFDDLTNKRNVRIKITELGKLEIVKILPFMKKVSVVVAANLSETEKKALIYILKKLDNFHNDIFMNKREMELNQIIETLGNQ
jgi:DNA-binding MarR family transcriptional regulator